MRGPPSVGNSWNLVVSATIQSQSVRTKQCRVVCGSDPGRYSIHDTQTR